MKRKISILTLASLAVACSSINLSLAQLPAPNEAGVTMGHLHMVTPNVEATKKVFATMGGIVTKREGAADIVKFPGVLVFFREGEPTGPTVGSVVNHIGFLVPNTQQAIAKWKAAGLNAAPGAANRSDQGFVTTPEGVRIEILEDKAQTVPIRSHHTHFNVAESAIPEIQAWYAKFFGAKPGMRGQNQAADVPGMNLTFSRSAEPTVPTRNRALDHIGFEVKNLEAFCKKLEASGIKLDRAYGKTATGLGIAFVTDPWGTYIELNEGLDKL
ncbi:MAG: VOC family protein [Terriglobia bacterium]